MARPAHRTALSGRARGERDSAAARLKRALSKGTLWRALGLLIIAAFVACAVCAPLLTTRDPLAQDLPQRLRPPIFVDPNSGFALGSDSLGRDLWSRLLYGARTSLFITAAATALAAVVGVGLGLAAGFRGGWLDALLSRWADVQQAVPYLILAIAVVAVLGSTVPNLVLILGLTTWLAFFRVVRAQTLALRESEFVMAARATGARSGDIMARHILPNLGATVAVLVTLLATNVVVFEASLGFLGLGVPPPQPSWGGLIAEGRDYLADAWWLSVIPGALLVLLAFGLNLVGDEA